MAGVVGVSEILLPDGGEGVSVVAAGRVPLCKETQRAGGSRDRRAKVQALHSATPAHGKTWMERVYSQTGIEMDSAT